MYSSQKTSINEGKNRTSRFHRISMKEGVKYASRQMPRNHSMRDQIAKLEEENAKLRETVLFLQELMLEE